MYLSGHTSHTIQVVGVDDYIQTPTIVHTIDIVSRALNYVVLPPRYRLGCRTHHTVVRRSGRPRDSVLQSHECGLASYYHLGNIEDSI